MNDPLLRMDDICVQFDGVQALTAFNGTVRPGEILGLFGPNGAGKTTLFNIISGFILPDKGRITFNDCDITGMPPHRIAAMGISRTFQDLRLIRQVTVLENVMLYYQSQPGEWLRNVFFRPTLSQRCETSCRDKALYLLETTELRAKADQPAEALSFGQQKLLSLVCCLASDSALLLLDEPVAGIAPDLTVDILRIVRAMQEQGKSVILIEHNLDAMLEVCDRLLFLDAGVKVTEGSPEEVRHDPRVVAAYLD